MNLYNIIFKINKLLLVGKLVGFGGKQALDFVIVLGKGSC